MSYATIVKTGRPFNVPVALTIVGMPYLVMCEILTNLHCKEIPALSRTCETTRNDTTAYLYNGAARMSPMRKLHGITQIKFCRLNLLSLGAFPLGDSLPLLKGNIGKITLISRK